MILGGGGFVRNVVRNLVPAVDLLDACEGRSQELPDTADVGQQSLLLGGGRGGDLPGLRVRFGDDELGGATRLLPVLLGGRFG